jgi:hypothetical protein
MNRILYRIISTFVFPGKEGWPETKRAFVVWGNRRLLSLRGRSVPEAIPFWHRWRLRLSQRKDRYARNDACPKVQTRPETKDFAPVEDLE